MHSQPPTSFSKRWPGKPFNFSANLRHSQNTSTKMVNLTLPSVSFNMSRLYPFKFKKSMGDKWYEKIELRVSSEMQNTITAPDSLLFTPQAHWRNGLRYDIPFGATVKLAKKGFFRHFSLSPSFDYTGRLYTNYVEKAYRDVMVYDTNTSEGRLVTDTLVIDTTQAIRHAFMVSPSVSLSFSPRLYGSYAFKNPNNHALKVVRHVMNLSMSANFKPRFGDDSKYYRTLYDTTGREQERYFIYQDGYSLSQTSDRSAGISFNLSNNLEAKIKQRNDTTDDEPKKVKLIDNLSVSTSYNVFADSLNLMPISISARTRIIKNMVDITTNARFDPYSVDYKGRTINKLEFAKNHRLARFNNMYTSMSLTLSPEAFKKDTKDQKDKKEVVPIVYSPEAIPYITFNVPWSVSVNYTLQYLQVANSYDPLKDKFDYKIQQSINFSGNFELTPKWKFGFTSGYEFTSGEFTYTSANLYRDLHCFEMAINWVPFGARQSYNFRINIKSSIFKGLEYKKKKSMFDYM